MATLLFLGLNGITISSDPDRDEALVVAAATGKLNVGQIASESANLR